MKASPMALICITLMVNTQEPNKFTIEDVPQMFKEEVMHFYPLSTGRQVELDNP